MLEDVVGSSQLKTFFPLVHISLISRSAAGLSSACFSLVKGASACETVNHGNRFNRCSDPEESRPLEKHQPWCSLFAHSRRWPKIKQQQQQRSRRPNEKMKLTSAELKPVRHPARDSQSNQRGNCAARCIIKSLKNQNQEPKIYFFEIKEK